MTVLHQPTPAYNALTGLKGKFKKALLH
jgi:hypothetical protein